MKNVDEIYYRVTYLDPGMRFPEIKAYVFLGVNLSDEDVDGDIWYFQDVYSYCETGSALTATEPGTPVECLTTEQLVGDMFDIDQLRASLIEVKARCG
ncbi:hypothetical protein ACM9XA_03335 [Xanthomonas sacchari]|uniref:hypothetical protein n=1 Tax=Xanthomonas TaxID=338 RepID=UPI0012633074|nr:MULTISPECIES: hypothetical protein [Xanthomonas]